MPTASQKFAFYVSSTPGSLLQYPGAPPGTWVGAVIVGGVPTADPAIIVPVSRIEFAANKAAWNQIKPLLSIRTEADYIAWIGAQDALVNLDDLIATNYASYPAQARALLIDLLGLLMDRDTVSRYDFKVALSAVIASLPPHPYDARTVVMMTWQELADGCAGAPVCTIAVLADPTVDESTPLDVMTKKLAQRLVAQRIANGG